MRNETFKTISFWGSFVAVILSAINIVMCLVKSIKLYMAGEGSDFMDVLSNTAGTSFGTVLYKVAAVVLIISLLMYHVSFLVNTDGALKVTMIIVKIVQMVCLLISVLGYFVLQNLSVIKLSLIVIGIFELIALILYLIDSDHRKCLLKVAVHSVITLGAGAVFFVIANLVIAAIIISIGVFLIKLFKDPGHRYTYRDSKGNVISYWVTRDY